MSIYRNFAIDVHRGGLILLMVADHSLRFLLGADFGEFWFVTDYKFPALGFALVRFLSYSAVTGFFFIMGVSLAYMVAKQLQHGCGQREIQWRTIRRGSLLIIIQILLVNVVWFAQGESDLLLSALMYYQQLFTMTLPYMYVGVLATLGVSLVLVSTILFVPSRILLAISGIVFLLGVSASGYYQQVSIIPGMALALLAVPYLTEGVFAYYSILPWCGFTLVGLLVGRAMLHAPRNVYYYMWRAGVVLVAIGVALRLLAIANSPFNTYDSIVSFFTLTKYPPSVVFILVTLGLNLLTLTLLQSYRSNAVVVRGIALLGQTSLFVYVGHLFILLLMNYWWSISSWFHFGLAFLLLLAILYLVSCIYHERHTLLSWLLRG